jgi:hypothetical protein
LKTSSPTLQAINTAAKSLQYTNYDLRRGIQDIESAARIAEGERDDPTGSVVSAITRLAEVQRCVTEALNALRSTSCHNPA